MKLFKYSIRKTIILTVIICTLLSLGIFARITYPNMQHNISQVLEQNYQLSINTVGEQLDSALYDMHLTAASLAHTGITGEIQEYLLTKDILDAKALYEKIQRQLIIEDSFSSLIGTICYYFPDGNNGINFISNNPVNTFIPQTDSILYRQIPLTDFNFPKSSVSSPLPVLSLTRWVGELGHSDYDEYYVYLESDPDYLTGLFSDLTDNNGVQIPVYLVDNSNIVAFSLGPDCIAVGEPFLQESLEKEGMLFSYENENWRLFLCVPAEDYHAIQIAAVKDFLLIIVFFLVAYVLLSVLVSRLAYKPIDLFIKELKENNSTGFIRRKNYSEFNEVSEKMNEMRNEINQLIIRTENQSKQNAYLEYQLLLSRINPHFLHNALNCISVEASCDGQNELSETIQNLNNLLHYNLKKDKITTLRDEISVAEDYIHLQHKLRSFKFVSLIDIPEDMLNFQIPTYILQPLLENCFKHSNVENLEIRLSISNHKDDISILIENNGQCISPQKTEFINDQFKASSSEGLGIGLSYVSSSLKLFYGNNVVFRVISPTKSDINGTSFEIIINTINNL